MKLIVPKDYFVVSMEIYLGSFQVKTFKKLFLRERKRAHMSEVGRRGRQDPKKALC